MAFAQFYYDPALEFERLLDEHATPPPPSQGSELAAGVGQSHVATAYVGEQFLRGEAQTYSECSMPSTVTSSGKPHDQAGGTVNSVGAGVLFGGLFKRRAQAGCVEERPRTGCR